MKYAFGPFVLDVSEYRLTRNGDSLPLHRKRFDLLALLVSRHGQLVTRDEILRTIWKDVTVEQASLNVAISGLRQALGDDAAALVETVPGRGYRFTGSVTAVRDGAAHPTQRPDLPRVVVVDDHAVVRMGLRTMLQDSGAFIVTGEASTLEEATVAIETQKPHLVVLDLVLNGESSLRCIRPWRGAVPGLRVIVLSMHHEDEWAREALAAGAHGYVMKAEAVDELEQAIATVMADGVWVSAAVSRKIVKDAVAGRPLSG